MLSRVRLAAVSTCRTVSGYKPSRFSANCVAIASRSCATAQQPKEPKEEAKKQSNEIAAFDFEKYDNQDDYEPQNAREKVAFYGAFAMRLALLGLAVVCIGFTARELFPGRMSPQSLFSEVFDYIRYKEQVQEMVGDGAKAFGRDTGRNTEGRRNHVDSYTYKGEDGSNRLRIRFNVKGEKGHILVWAEVSDKMPDSEYVYVIVQDRRTGRVYTVVDNRDSLEAGMYSSGNEGDQAISKFFFGGK